MRLNTIKPAEGSKKARTRVGRGIGCGKGKTCGRGHKGQHSRSGGYHKVGFEGGQMPIQRRVPKFGFTSRQSLVSAEIRLSELNNLNTEVITVDTLRSLGLINSTVTSVKVFLSGEIQNAISLKGIRVSKGAREAIESAGGKVEE
tara:strand:+ start:338 stop:772 length:435 start_codon:yes stop_codon:yes gene_type:complete